MYPITDSLHCSRWCPSLGENRYECCHPECSKVFMLKMGYTYPLWKVQEGKLTLLVRAYCSLVHLTANEPPHGIG